MNYLNDRIRFALTGNVSTHNAGVYRYELIRDNDTSHPLVERNFYYDGVTNYKYFDLTDVIRSDGWVASNSTLDVTSAQVYPVNLQNHYYVRVWWSDSVSQNTNIVTVNKVWKKTNAPDYTEVSPADIDGAYPMLQGMDMSKGYSEFKLVPHYPFKWEENKLSVCPFAQTFWLGENMISPYGGLSTFYFDYLKSGGVWEEENIQADLDYSGTQVYINRLDDLINEQWFIGAGNQPTGDGKLFFEDENENLINFAIFDYKPKPFYLIWQDRFGGFQSQGFTCKWKYSEDIKRDELMTYKDERRNYNIQVQPKWKIATPWLKQEEYPLYESIFTSPVLILHDVENNRNYPVILSNGNYEEKRYKTENGLINFSIEVELDTKQNIIY